MTKRDYPALRTASAILKAIAIVVAVGAILAAILGYFTLSETSTGAGLMYSVWILVAGAFGAVSAFAMAELILLLIDIEQNTRQALGTPTESSATIHQDSYSLQDTGESVEIDGKRFVILVESPGTAFCMGCRETGEKSGMYFCEAADTYYHERCLPSR